MPFEKLQGKPEDYLLLKYVNGSVNNWYVVSSEAYKNYKLGHIDTMTIYKWEVGYKYEHKRGIGGQSTVTKLSERPKDVHDLLKEQNPALYEWFQPKDAVSSRMPNPKDDYVVIGIAGWSLVKKSELNSRTPEYYCLKTGTWKYWSGKLTARTYTITEIRENTANKLEGFTGLSDVKQYPYWPTVDKLFLEFDLKPTAEQPSWETNPSRYRIGMWTASNYCLVLASAVLDTSATLRYTAWDDPGEVRDKSRTSFMKFLDWDEIDPAKEIYRKLKGQNPKLFKIWEDFYAAKTPVKHDWELHPDKYFVAFGRNSGAAYIYLRETSYGSTIAWADPSLSSGCQISNTTGAKKYPQLNSTEKMRLRKDNVTLFNIWEAFYVKKYKMQPTKPEPQAETIAIPAWVLNPELTYIGSFGSGWCLVNRKEWDSSSDTIEFVMWESALRMKHWGRKPRESFAEVHKENDKMIGQHAIGDHLKAANPGLYQIYSQYVNELPKKVTEPKPEVKPAPVNNMHLIYKNVRDYGIFTRGYGFEIYSVNEFTFSSPYDFIYVIAISDGTKRQITQTQLRSFKLLTFSSLNPTQKAVFEKQNILLYNAWAGKTATPELTKAQGDIFSAEQSAKLKSGLLESAKITMLDLSEYCGESNIRYVPSADAHKTGYLDHDSGVFIETEPKYTTVVAGDFNYLLGKEGDGKNQFGGPVWAKYRRVGANMSQQQFEPEYMQHPKNAWSPDNIHPNQDSLDYMIKAVGTVSNKIDKQQNSLTSNTNNKMNFKQLLPNFEFGKINTDKLALSFAGTAFKAQDGSFKTFDLNTKQLIDCGDLKFDVDFYRMPVAKLEAGDITELDGAFYIVEKVNEDGSFTGIVPTTGTRSNKLARNNIFGMYFYTKIVNLFAMFQQPGATAPAANNPFGAMNPMMLMMMSGKGEGKEGGMGDMMEMMMMSQLFGGGQASPFGAFGQPAPVVQAQAAPVTTKAPAKKSRAKTAAGKARAAQQGLDTTK